MDDSETIRLWGQIIRGVGIANRRLHARIRAEFELNEAEVDTVITLGGLPDRRATMAALAASASFTTGGYTKVADRLVERGLLRRVPGTQDRRVVYLELTPEGVEMASALRRLVADTLRLRVVEVLGEDRVRSMAATAEALRVALVGE